MPYDVRFKSSARREYDALEYSVKPRVRAAIDGLEQEPRPHGVINLTHSGDEYRIQVGAHRVVYTTDDA